MGATNSRPVPTGVVPSRMGQGTKEFRQCGVRLFVHNLPRQVIDGKENS
jgi:hypothetical protein